MARPKTKSELLSLSTENYQKLMELLKSIPASKVKEPFTFDIEKEKQAHWQRDKNVRDVLIHLYEWHQLLLNWVTENQAGRPRQFLEEGYNWRNYGAMNEAFVVKHQNTTYEEAIVLLTDSHQKVMDLADIFTNEELFSKDIFPWVGGSTLGSYFVSATSSHYEWALKKLRKFKKSL